jgi:DNA-binding CsgD family transcriptional regulator
VKAAAADADGAVEQLQLAVKLATDQGRPAARCEDLAILAMEAALLGVRLADERLLGVAEQAARDVHALMPMLPGHPLWGAQAHAALARIELHRGDADAAVRAARLAMAGLEEAQTEDLHLDIKLPAADALLAAGTVEEQASVRGLLQFTLQLMVPRFTDDRVRVQWLASPTGRELVRLASLDVVEPSTAPDGDASVNAAERAMLELLVQGKANREIGETLGMTENVVAQRLAEIFVKIGVSSRADATAAALMGKLV